MAKDTPKVIGKIGSHDVVDYNGFPCLVMGKTTLGCRKIKDVLAAQVACKEFLAKYDVAKPAPAQTPAASAALDRTAINQQIADLQAAIAKLTPAPAPAAPAAANGRFVPAA